MNLAFLCFSPSCHFSLFSLPVCCFLPFLEKIDSSSKVSDIQFIISSMYYKSQQGKKGGREGIGRRKREEEREEKEERGRQEGSTLLLSPHMQAEMLALDISFRLATNRSICEANENTEQKKRFPILSCRRSSPPPSEICISLAFFLLPHPLSLTLNQLSSRDRSLECRNRK